MTVTATCVVVVQSVAVRARCSGVGGVEPSAHPGTISLKHPRWIQWPAGVKSSRAADIIW